MTDTATILAALLDTIRRDGWNPDSWGLVPPWNIRAALNHVVAQTYKDPDSRAHANTTARQAISRALGQPLGLISVWEGKPGRTQSAVETLLEKAIAGVGG
jgi:hypothetical protein